MFSHTPHDLHDLADLAETETPHPDTDGAQFLHRVAGDVANRLGSLGARLHADEIASIGEASLTAPDLSVWAAWMDLGLWTEDVVALVRHDDPMTWRAEAALVAVASRMAAGLVARDLAARAGAA